MEPFKEPIYVTRPLLPDLNKVQNKLQEIWTSQWLTNCGPQHKLLETALTKKLQVPYLSLFNNGTTALMIACQALRLSGKVITTPFTFAATPHVFDIPDRGAYFKLPLTHLHSLLYTPGEVVFIFTTSPY